MDELINYGALGIMCIVMIVYIYHLTKEHRKERREWRETTEKQFETIAEDRQKETVLLTKITTMLESRK